MHWQGVVSGHFRDSGRQGSTLKDSGDKFERKPQGRQMGSKIQTQTLSFEGTLSGQCSCQYVSPQRPEI